MKTHLKLNGMWLLLVLAAVSAVQADESRIFKEGRSGGGELKYINDLPVLIVSGTPEEIGEQKAALTGDAVKKLIGYPKMMLEKWSREDRLPKYLERSKAIAAQLPQDHRDELRAFSKQLGVDQEMGLLGNMLADIYRGSFSCSSLIVEPEKSATKEMLFGRNLDFYTLGILDKYSLVTVHRPKGKHAFASVGFPGLFGCLSGMNDAGLSLAVHEAFFARDGAAMFNPKGMPYTFCFRRILEECSTVEEAEKLLRSTERTTLFSLAVCDRKHCVVLESTPKTVADRHASGGILACTNFFRTDELSVFLSCNRYKKLLLAKKLDQLDVSDVAKKMDEVNMGGLTAQTMIFEPATQTLHLAIGSTPSSALPLKKLDLKPLFKP
jgi:isopenicillin-N N-acyltransferase like protein